MLALVQDALAAEPGTAEVAEALRTLGYQVKGFSAEPETIDRLPLHPDVFIYGALWVMLRLVRRAGLRDRIVPPYPAPLRPMLHRRVWQGTLADLARSDARRVQPLFVRVANVCQRIDEDAFASQVIDSLALMEESDRIRPETLILCSEPVEWIAEWRAYVQQSRLLDTFLYLPSLPDLDLLRPEMLMDLEVIPLAIQELKDCGLAVAGYSLDFGVMGNGQSALIEMNDGISLCNYGLPAEQHVQLHAARWRELMRLLPSAQANPGGFPASRRDHPDGFY